MADETILELDSPELAPEPPPHGPWVWAKINLFSTWQSVVLTIFGLLVAALVVRSIVGFVFNEERQWQAVTTNLRLLMVQAYPDGDLWRVWFSLGIVIVLLGLSFAVWRVGGRSEPRSVMRGVSGVGAALLFATLVGGVFFNVATWIIGFVLSLFGGDSPEFDLIEPFSTSQFIWWSLIGVALAAIGSGVTAGLGERAKRASWSTLGLIALGLGAIVASLWVLKVPVPDPSGAVRVSVLQSIADTTAGPWTLLFVALVVSYLIGVAVRDRLPEGLGRKILTVGWVLSFPVIVLHLLRNVAFQDVGQYLVIGVAFAVVGSALLFYLAGRVGEGGRAIAGVILALALASWVVSSLMLVRLLLLALAAFALAAPTFGGGRGRATNRYIMVWVGATIVIVYLMLLSVGGTQIITPNETPFGGFLLTWILALAGIALAFPLGVLLALGRTSTMPIFRLMSTFYIEVVRGVPLITWLLVSVVVFPIFFPLGTAFVAPAKVIVFISLFSAAYLAENVRGGLQSIPSGQAEAANALGMTTLQRTVFITLPQALRAVIPALVGQVIALFKDTSLVAIVGLFDLLKIAKDVIPSQTQPFNFLGSLRESLLFVAVVYWIFTFTISRVSLRLEKKLGVGER